MPIDLGGLLDSFSGQKQSEEYTIKMMHPVPDVPSVNRTEYILEKCKDKNVADFGCASGELHSKIKAVAKSIFGFDKEQPADKLIDFDDPSSCDLTCGREIDVYVLGEVIEHTRNPGFFLDNLRRAMNKEGSSKVCAVITAPNAFSEAALRQMLNGIECVNKDHKFWPSFFTLKNMLERSDFIVTDFKWYNGRPRFAEGLVFTVE